MSKPAVFEIRARCRIPGFKIVAPPACCHRSSEPSLPLPKPVPEEIQHVKATLQAHRNNRKRKYTRIQASPTGIRIGGHAQRSAQVIESTRHRDSKSTFATASLSSSPSSSEECGTKYRDAKFIPQELRSTA